MDSDEIVLVVHIPLSDQQELKCEAPLVDVTLQRANAWRITSYGVGVPLPRSQFLFNAKWVMA